MPQINGEHFPARRRGRWLIATVFAYQLLPCWTSSWTTAVEESAGEPLSPGQVVLLIRQAESPQAVETLRRALRDDSAVIRAAAGRVIRASQAAVPVEDLRKALQAETDPSAALEEAAALVPAGGGGTADLILQAGKRLGGGMVAAMSLMAAKARGPEGINLYISDLRSLALSSGQRATCILTATRYDVTALNSAGRFALEANDTETWLAVLKGAAGAGVDLDTSLLVTALNHPSRELAGETAWQLAKIYSHKAPHDKTALWTATANTVQRSDGKVDVDLWFGTELLSRVLGRQPVENQPWMDSLRTSSSCRMDLPENADALETMLTPTEGRALQKRFERLFPGRDLLTRKGNQATYAQRTPMSSPEAPPDVRLASGFPPGFVSGTLDASHCRIPSQPLVGEADVSYDVIGRPTRIVLTRVPQGRQCTEAVKALFAATTAPPGEVTNPATPVTLIMILESGALSRLEENVSADEIRYLTASGTEPVLPPKRTRFVKPEFPESARRRGVEAKVIVEIVVNEEGLVSEMRLLKEASRNFVSSAFLAVSQWRYDPALVGGKPVKVYLTVIVEWGVH